MIHTNSDAVNEHSYFICGKLTKSSEWIVALLFCKKCSDPACGGIIKNIYSVSLEITCLNDHS